MKQETPRNTPQNCSICATSAGASISSGRWKNCSVFAEIHNGFAGIDRSFAEIRRGFARTCRGFAVINRGFAWVRRYFAGIYRGFAAIQRRYVAIQRFVFPGCAGGVWCVVSAMSRIFK